MKSLIKHFRGLYRILTEAFHDGWAFLFPSVYARYLFKKNLNKKLDLKSPKDYNEKVQWLKIYSDTTEWTRLADKYKVRDYIIECGLEDILVKLYGAWDRAGEINFSSLPDKFVLKTNNSCGKVILVHDKSELNLKEIRNMLDSWVTERHGLMSFEPHYWNIERKIIAEELLEDYCASLQSSSLIDYKFWCIHGEPVVIMVLYDRPILSVGQTEKKMESRLQAAVFNLDWEHRPGVIAGPLSHTVHPDIPRPKCLDKMIAVCRILSQPFIQVRVDLYEVNESVYFGEMTFTPGGNLSYFTPEFFREMGDKMDLSKARPRPTRFIV